MYPPSLPAKVAVSREVRRLARVPSLLLRPLEGHPVQRIQIWVGPGHGNQWSSDPPGCDSAIPRRWFRFRKRWPLRGGYRIGREDSAALGWYF